MPYTNPKHKTRHQRQRRRAGMVRRIEVTLSADSERDHDIADYLDSLPKGEGAEFIRQAIIEKIDRDTTSEAQPIPDRQPVSVSDEFNALFAELDHQRRSASEQMEAMIATIAAQSEQIAALRDQLARQPEPVAVAAPVETASAGIDTGRPRPPAPPPTLPEQPETTTASGIDMSRPRPRKTQRSAPPSAPASEPATLSEAEQIRLAQVMAKTIRNAQPGRSQRRE
jgi:hypothetical protein